MLESVAIWMMAPAIAALTVGGSTVPERVAEVEPVSVVIHVAQNKTNNTSEMRIAIRWTLIRGQ
jgi:hypothetical protein